MSMCRFNHKLPIVAALTLALHFSSACGLAGEDDGGGRSDEDAGETDTLGVATSPTTTGPSNSTESSAGAAGEENTGVESTGTGTDDCAALVGDSMSPVTIHIVNAFAADIELADGCWAEGVDGLRVDGLSAVDLWYRYSCDDVLAGQCSAPDCWGGDNLVLAAGATHVEIWDGRLVTAESLDDLVAVPGGCEPGCEPSDVGSCVRAIAVDPGPHTLEVEYYLIGETRSVTVQRSFEMPSERLVITLGP